MEDGQTIGDSSFCFLSLIVFVQKQPRSDAAGVALGGKVYVVGGFDGTNQLRSVERFNPRTDQWKKVFFCYHWKIGPFAGEKHAHSEIWRRRCCFGRSSLCRRRVGRHQDQEATHWGGDQQQPHVDLQEALLSRCTTRSPTVGGACPR